MRVHIFGGSGSGTSTLARALARSCDGIALDTDDFYWMPTEPPYRTARPVEERLGLLRAALDQAPSWVLAGSLSGWGDPLVPLFELVVFLHTPTELRLERLRTREQERFGSEALAPGGEMHDNHRDFIEWARSYDDGDLSMRSLALHEAWLDRLPCTVLRLDGARPTEELTEAVLVALERG
jgi:adenylate kinase family enzyme